MTEPRLPAVADPQPAGTATTAPSGERHRLPLPCTVVLVVTTAVVGTSAVLGALAAVVGGPLSALGAGPGGLWGVPQLVLVAVAALVGAPAGLAALVLSIRRGGRRRATYGAALALVPLFLAVASFTVPHALEPCDGGLWDLRTRVASAPACTVYGGGITIDDRFHLLLHGGVTAPIAVPALLGLRAAARRIPPRGTRQDGAAVSAERPLLASG